MAVVGSKKKFTKTGSQLVSWTLTRKFASQSKGHYMKIYGTINNYLIGMRRSISGCDRR